MPSVIETVSDRDLMFNPADRDHYFWAGEEALKCIRLALELSQVSPNRILDLPCGHGRVLRWLVTKYPEAEITACDLDRDAVDFCAEHFDVTPIYSEVEPKAIPLGDYDLTWVGSLFTHLDAPMWPRFLSVLSEHTDLLVFTTGGRYFGDEAWLRQYVGDRAPQLIESYDETGFAYVEYPFDSSCGLTRAKSAWVLDLLDRLSLRVLHFAEGGWGSQDVYVCRRGS